MLRWRKRIRKISYILVDMISILGAFIIGEIFYEDVLGHELTLTEFERIAIVMLFMTLLVMINLMLNVYEQTIENFGRMSKKIALKMVLSLGTTNVIMGFMFFAFGMMGVQQTFLGVYGGFIIVLMILNRILLKQFTGSPKKAKNMRNILVVGKSGRGLRYIEEIKKHDYLNFNLMGYVCIKDDNSYEGLETIGSLGDLPRIATEYVVDEIAVARPLSYDERLSDMLRVCQDMGITVTMLLETQNKDSKAQVAMIGDLPVLKFHTVSLNESQLFMKRVLDVIGGSVGLVLFGIAYLIVGPIIKLETPGPVIFKQDRVGRNGRIFQVWKFRSMGVNAEDQKAALMANNEMSGHMFKMTNDPRITKVGAFIRKTSIDELPQFWNVLRGDMSLVGTRPPTVKEVHEYQAHHHKRISITPGITGNWQVSGRSDIEDFEEVVRLDDDYIRDWTIWSDIKILFKTILVVLKRDGSK